MSLNAEGSQGHHIVVNQGQSSIDNFIKNCFT